MQLRHLGFPADLRIRCFVVKRLGQVLDGLPFPLGDLVVVRGLVADKRYSVLALTRDATSARARALAALGNVVSARLVPPAE